MRRRRTWRLSGCDQRGHIHHTVHQRRDFDDNARAAPARGEQQQSPGRQDAVQELEQVLVAPPQHLDEIHKAIGATMAPGVNGGGCTPGGSTQRARGPPVSPSSSSPKHLATSGGLFHKTFITKGGGRERQWPQASRQRKQKECSETDKYIDGFRAEVARAGPSSSARSRQQRGLHVGRRLEAHQVEDRGRHLRRGGGERAGCGP